MKTLVTALALTIAVGAVPALAANARQPYANIDRRIDRGNDTGDSRVESLNQQQLDSVRSQSGVIVGAPVIAAPMGAVGAPGYPAPGPMPGAPMPLAPAYPGAPR